jgi:protein gp37
VADKTGIEWTDASWNPIRGCTRVSEGCRHCYAEVVAARFSGPGQAYEGLARRTSKGEARWTGKIMFVEKHLEDPLRWKEPRRIFVNSMSDLFHEGVADEQLDRIFAVMALSPRHTFQVLTKRPERMREYFAGDQLAERVDALVESIAFERTDPHNRRTDDLRAVAQDEWPLPNVWLGVSVENQAAADERIPILVETPAALRFLSCEPLLGPIDFYGAGSRGPEEGDPESFSALAGYAGTDPKIPGIDWVIVGGESGAQARVCDVRWFRDIARQCNAWNVPVFVKQLGRHPVERTAGVVTWPEVDLRDSHGGDQAEWPEDLRVREFPTERALV